MYRHEIWRFEKKIKKNEKKNWKKIKKKCKFSKTEIKPILFKSNPKLLPLQSKN
jgi:hypothetical protein